MIPCKRKSFLSKYKSCEKESEKREREQERVWWAADTLDNSGNEALAESDNYFN